ncbi:recombination regulator RecX [Lentilactobacillus senioris]|uniref:recombination regulator RecX n=1 Tax=Lentilactobacillus senioris TaxID=931534 RepID=UPI0022830D45|nr:recombination regulator RecX [Lentilactobacillus senioris]MCY9806700.1 recombination regulator RecX [Lentilactobacillus senioris]
MKKITKIEAQRRKGRYNIYLDDQYAFPISEDVLINFQIFKGMEVDDQLQQQIQDADTVSKLYNRALNYLAHQLRSVAEVRTKLAELTDDEQRITEVIERLQDQQLLNDQRYAESYVRTIVNEAQKGPGAIQNQLRQKKITANEIEAAIQNYYPITTQIEIGQKVAQNQLKKNHRESGKMAVDKTRQTLYRKGFTAEVIEIVMQEVVDDSVYADDQENIQRIAEKYWHKFRAEETYKRTQKTKQALYRKGFSLDDIEKIISELN